MATNPNADPNSFPQTDDLYPLEDGMEEFEDEGADADYDGELETDGIDHLEASSYVPADGLVATRTFVPSRKPSRIVHAWGFGTLSKADLISLCAHFGKTLEIIHFAADSAFLQMESEQAAANMVAYYQNQPVSYRGQLVRFTLADMSESVPAVNVIAPVATAASAEGAASAYTFQGVRGLASSTALASGGVGAAAPLSAVATRYFPLQQHHLTQQQQASSLLVSSPTTSSLNASLALASSTPAANVAFLTTSATLDSASTSAISTDGFISSQFGSQFSSGLASATLLPQSFLAHASSTPATMHPSTMGGVVNYLSSLNATGQLYHQLSAQGGHPHLTHFQQSLSLPAQTGTASLSASSSTGAAASAATGATSTATPADLGAFLGNEDKPNVVLLVSIFDTRLPVTIENLYQVFSQFGEVLKIVTFIKNLLFKALIQFRSLEAAIAARNNLDGKDIFQDCCTLRIQYSRLTELTVKENGHRARDFTLPTYVQAVPAAYVMTHMRSVPTAAAPVAMSNQSTPGADGGVTMIGASPSTMSQARMIASNGVTPYSVSPVLLCSNLDEKRITPDILFTLFGVYGDVVRVKIFFNKQDTALIEFADPHAAVLAQSNLNKVELFGRPMSITPSKHNRVSVPRIAPTAPGVATPFMKGDLDADTGDTKSEASSGPLQTGKVLTKDYSNSQHHRFKFNRFTAYRYVTPPGPVLHVSNLHGDANAEELHGLFGAATVAVQFFRTDRRMAFVRMQTTNDAVTALVLLHNHILGGKPIRLSFSHKRPEFIKDDLKDPNGATDDDDETPEVNYGGPSRSYYNSQDSNTYHPRFASSSRGGGGGGGPTRRVPFHAQQHLAPHQQQHQYRYQKQHHQHATTHQQQVMAAAQAQQQHEHLYQQQQQHAAAVAAAVGSHSAHSGVPQQLTPQQQILLYHTHAGTLYANAQALNAQAYYAAAAAPTATPLSTSPPSSASTPSPPPTSGAGAQQQLLVGAFQQMALTGSAGGTLVTSVPMSNGHAPVSHP